MKTEITLPDASVNVRGGAGLSATGAGDFPELGLADDPPADSPEDTAGDSAMVGAGDACVSVVGLGEAAGWFDAVFGDDEQPNWTAIIVANSRQQKIDLFDRYCI
ncbi:MAG: hypothetical protein L0220_09340 [Acidobacteria bacterium]|nr:hypothetical protein [Acidobacteriota bacterium]